jgi:hypothetical protein
MLQTPTDYEFVEPSRSYSSGLSKTRRLETQRRYLTEKHDKILHDVIQMESRMNIARRWQPSDMQYMKTVKYMATRKYQQALDHLHRLVVQRLFELHKVNLSKTGTSFGSSYIAVALT